MANVLSNNKQRRYRDLINLATGGLARYLAWSFIATLNKSRSARDQGLAARVTYRIVLIATLLPVAWLLASLILGQEVEALPQKLIALGSAILTLYLAHKHDLKVFILVPLAINLVQSLELYKLVETGLFSLELLVLVTLQAVLVLPSLETYEKSQLARIFSEAGMGELFSWYSTLTKSFPESLSQLYRDYLLVVATVFIMVSARAQASTEELSSMLSFEGLLGSSQATALLIFATALALILLRTGTTSSKSGWGRNAFSNMQETFNIIISMYLLALLFMIALWRFSFSLLGKADYSPATMVIDILFLGLIFHFLLKLGSSLIERPNYEIEESIHEVIAGSRGVRQVVFILQNKGNSPLECRIAHQKKLALSFELDKRITCPPGRETNLLFEYDRAVHQGRGVELAFADVEVSSRGYKHRLIFGALQHHQLGFGKVSAELQTREILQAKVRARVQSQQAKSERPENNISFDRLQVLEEIDFNPRAIWVLEANVGLLNFSGEECKFGIWNRDALVNNNMQVMFNAPKQDGLGRATFGWGHHPRAITIRFRYSDLELLSGQGTILSILSVSVNDYSIIRLPITIQVRPKIYNDTDVQASVEYPDGSSMLIQPGDAEVVLGTDVPVRVQTEGGRSLVGRVGRGLTLISSFSRNLVSAERRPFVEIALVGLNNSGKTTYATVLAIEGSRPDSPLKLTQHFGDKVLDQKFQDSKNRVLRDHAFPASTPVSDFSTYNFTANLKSGRSRIALRDIAGEFFASDKALADQSLPRQAEQHIENVDGVFLFVDTDPAVAAENDHETATMIHNVLTSTQAKRDIRYSVLFTKADLSRIDASNRKNWLAESMPETAARLAAEEEQVVDSVQFSYFYLSIGSVTAGEIVDYQPQDILSPVGEVLEVASAGYGAR